MTRKINCQVLNEYVKGAGVVAGANGSHDDVLLHLVFDDFWDDLTKKITWVDAYGESSTLTLLTQTMISDDGYDVPIPYEAKKYPGKMKMTVRGCTCDTHVISATVDKDTWEDSSLGGTDGTYVFSYSGSSWYRSSTAVTLATYGIVVTGTPVDGDKLTVTRATASSVVSVIIVAEAYHEEYRATLSASCEFIILESAWDDDAEEGIEISASQAASLQAEIDELEEDIQDIIDHVDDSEAWAVGQIDGTDVPATDTRYHNNSKYYSGQAALSAASAEVSEENALSYKTTAESAKNTAVSAKDTAVAAKDEAVSAESKIENMTATASSLSAGASPTVTKTETSTGFNLEFGIPQGASGATGAAAGFGSVSATIDNNQGIPSVTVTASGPDTAKVFAFDFKNLKGPKGDAGAGSGDMLMADYDSGAVVKNAGGIPAYVGAFGGKIDTIKVQGTAQTITNKTVDLDVITKITATGGLQSSTSGGQSSIELDSSSVASLAKADTAYQKPASGIPNSDIASASTWNAKANTPTWVTSYTLASSSWSSKTYSLESTYPFASYDIEISISPSATETQRDAYAEAMMTGSPSSNVITALGDAPTVDIPCYLQVRAK